MLICIIYLGFRRRLGSFSNFARFCQNKPRWNFWVSFFKKVHQKGLFGVEKENSNFRFLTVDSRKLQTVALKTKFKRAGICVGARFVRSARPGSFPSLRNAAFTAPS